jgi:Domain of unknown function (DUF3597)
MSIFGNIMSAIFGGAAHAEGAPPAAAPDAPTQVAAAAPSTSPAQAPTAMPTAPVSTSPDKQPNSTAPASSRAPVDVMAILDKIDDETDEKLDWSASIVDLMKLLKLDSSLAARKQLAKELGYTGDTKNSAEMNVWLHKQVMTKLAENGGIVPKELTH